MRYMVVGTQLAPRITGLFENQPIPCITYLDIYAPAGEQLRVCLEPIAEEI
jgi:hypothetical protein